MITKEHADEIRTLVRRLCEIATEADVSIISVSAYDGEPYTDTTTIHANHRQDVSEHAGLDDAGDAVHHKWFRCGIERVYIEDKP